MSAQKLACPSPSRAILPGKKIPSVFVPQALDSLSPYVSQLPINLLVDSKQFPRNSEQFECYTRSSTLPVGSLVKINEEIFVVTPELCFAQMATQLNREKLVLLAFELCGTYSVLSEGLTLYNCAPQTNPEKLKAYLVQATNMNGVKQAKEALSFVLSNSASPMESILTVLLTFPHNKGGYLLPEPSLNFRIYPSYGEKDFASQQFFSCDLYWPKEKVGLEYDSNLFHTGAERMTKDSQRRDQLAGMNLTVFTITTAQILDLNKFEQGVMPMVKVLKKRLRLPQDFRLKQRILHAALLPKDGL